MAAAGEQQGALGAGVLAVDGEPMGSRSRAGLQGPHHSVVKVEKSVRPRWRAERTAVAPGGPETPSAPPADTGFGSAVGFDQRLLELPKFQAEGLVRRVSGQARKGGPPPGEPSMVASHEHVL